MSTMILDKAELFYQKVNRLGLKIHEVDGFEYRYSAHGDHLTYQRWIGNYMFRVAVDIDDLLHFNDSPSNFAELLNEQLSKAYTKRVTDELQDTRIGGVVEITYR